MTQDSNASSPPSTRANLVRRSIPPASATAPSAAYNTRIIWSLARYLEDTWGPEALQSAAAAAGLSASDFTGKYRWLSCEEFESFLSAARENFRDDDHFKEGCVHRLAEGYGPVRFVLLATSPATIYALSAKHLKVVTTVSQYTVVSQSRTALQMRVTSERSFGRLVCLVRQAQAVALPTLWGLPAATLREDGCVAAGDAACNFHLRWYDTKRWLPILAGLGAGVGAMMALPPDLARFALPALGAAMGFIHELRRTERTNLVTRDEVTAALRILAEEGGEARREIMAINQRQRDWSRMLEDVAAERAAAVQKTIARLDELQTVRENKLLGVTHDLRSPLTVISVATDWLKENAGRIPDGVALVDDLTDAVARMKRMTQDLMQLASAQSSIMQLAPQRIEVAPLTETLRRRIRALVHGRDIRASVFGTREAPEYIQTDPLLFDRVIDNLLGNAAKYTARGSIVLEIDGLPGFLVIKISDTGRGIEPEALEKTFSPGGSDAAKRAHDSYGVGLSVVVQLLGQVGGRLDVMSKPGSGTTFWVYFPVNTGRLSLVPPRETATTPNIEPYRDILNRVVTIRRKTA